MTTTPSGLFRIFDVTEFLPGQPIPSEFLVPGYCDGPWYFMPTAWIAPHWGNASRIAINRNFPMCYSPGYATKEAALAAAIEWEPEFVRKEEGKLIPWTDLNEWLTPTEGLGQ